MLHHQRCESKWLCLAFWTKTYRVDVEVVITHGPKGLGHGVGGEKLALEGSAAANENQIWNPISGTTGNLDC